MSYKIVHALALTSQSIGSIPSVGVAFKIGHIAKFNLCSSNSIFAKGYDQEFT